MTTAEATEQMELTESAEQIMPVRERTWMEETIAENPEQVLNLDPDNPAELLIRPERNARGFTHEIGDKALNSLIAKLKRDGQTTPGFATLNEQGVADLYAGFRRAISIQTINSRLAVDEQPMKMRVLITDHVLSDLEIYERSLSENVDREGLTVTQKVNALIHLTGPDNKLTITQAAERLNMSKAAASIYLRFNLFPAVAKKALDNGDLQYKPAELLVALLPKKEQLDAAVDDDARKELLAKAQAKIEKIVVAQLAKGGKVKTSEVDKVTRKTAGGDGKAANKTQRKAAAVVKEIDEQITAATEESDGAVLKRLASVKRFINGGTMKGLLKGLE